MINWDDEFIDDISILLGNDDGLFTEKEIEQVLRSVESTNHALYILYTQKAGKVVNSSTIIKRITAGAESVEKLNALELQKAALTMAEHYKKLWQEEGKSNKEIGNTTFLY